MGTRGKGGGKIKTKAGIFYGSNLLVVTSKTVTVIETFKTLILHFICVRFYVQGGSNMTGTDLYGNKPHCAAAVRP